MTTTDQEALTELHALVVEDTEGSATIEGGWTRRIINDYSVDDLDVPGMGYRGPIING